MSVRHPQLPPEIPKGYKVYGVRVILHNFKLQWEGAHRDLGKKHEMVIAARNEDIARELAKRRCYQTENMANLFIDSIEVWEIEAKPRNN